MIYIGLGSNLGNSSRNLEFARKEIASISGIDIQKTSSVITTAPYGKLDQPEFLNQIIAIKTDLNPQILMRRFFEIEKSAGRERKEKWGPRTLDIDILFWNEQVIETEYLSVPHPDLHNRLFILESMMELEPDLVHPKLKKTIKELYQTRSNE